MQILNPRSPELRPIGEHTLSELNAPSGAIDGNGQGDRQLTTLQLMRAIAQVNGGDVFLQSGQNLSSPARLHNLAHPAGSDQQMYLVMVRPPRPGHEL